MKLAPQIKAFVLRTLRQRDGVPATEEFILLAITGAFPGDLSRDEARTILNNLADEGLLTSATQPILKTRSFTLTTAGQLAANQL